MAKLTLKLINDVANVVNQDPSVRGLLKIALLPNYNVTLAEVIMPAADLSEQSRPPAWKRRAPAT